MGEMCILGLHCSNQQHSSKPRPKPTHGSAVGVRNPCSCCGFLDVAQHSLKIGSFYIDVLRCCRCRQLWSHSQRIVKSRIHVQTVEDRSSPDLSLLDERPFRNKCPSNDIGKNIESSMRKGAHRVAHCCCGLTNI